jgi:hypothetical protein
MQTHHPLVQHVFNSVPLYLLVQALMATAAAAARIKLLQLPVWMDLQEVLLLTLQLRGLRTPALALVAVGVADQVQVHVPIAMELLGQLVIFISSLLPELFQVQADSNRFSKLATVQLFRHSQQAALLDQ